MGMTDKAKQKMNEGADAMKRAVDKAGDKADEMTGQKYNDKIEKGKGSVRDSMDPMSSHEPEPEQRQQ
jgi:hypothetical protein